MKVPNILLTRIDNRLVHGQVGVTWTKTIGANLLLVADDETAQDELTQRLMAVTAKSSGVGIRFFSIEKTAAIIGNAAPNQKIFIICKTPKDVRRLVDAGVEIKEVNVGNMHYADGKRQLTAKVYVDDQDMDDLKYLASKGIHVYAQDVPGIQKLRLNNTRREIYGNYIYTRNLTCDHVHYRRFGFLLGSIFPVSSFNGFYIYRNYFRRCCFRT